jgi:hypothetical protein
MQDQRFHAGMQLPQLCVQVLYLLCFLFKPLRTMQARVNIFYCLQYFTIHYFQLTQNLPLPVAPHVKGKGKEILNVIKRHDNVHTKEQE